MTKPKKPHAARRQLPVAPKNVAAHRAAKLHRLPVPVRRATDLTSFDPDRALKAMGVAKARADRRIIHNWRKDLCKTTVEVIDGKKKRVTVGDPDKFQKALDDAEHRALRACEREPTGTERGTKGTGEFERYTPAPYIAAVREVLGEIDLDPASNATGQKVVQAKEYFNQKKNGLQQQWHGRVFLNPPYHRELAPLFIDKLVEELNAGHATEAILLTNNSTDTDWFHVAQTHCAAICFTKGRIKFETPEGGMVLPTQGQAFMYYGDDIEKFARVFAGIGLLFVPYRPPLAHVAALDPEALADVIRQVAPVHTENDAAERTEQVREAS